MNYLFVLNAAILMFLGIYLAFINKNSLSYRFLISNTGLALWNICIFLLEEKKNLIDVDFIARLQLFFAMAFVNGVYYFCVSYPFTKKKNNYFINGICFFVMSYLLFFSNYITSARVENDQVVFTDSVLGFASYAAYLVILAAFVLKTLIESYRQYPDYKNKIKFIFLGLYIFTSFVMIFNILLPLLGVYEYLIIGRLSGIFPALFFAYAITKHDFMDISVVINKKVSWVLVGGLITASFSLAFFYDTGNQYLSFALIVGLGLCWSVIANPFQAFLLTSARRKFIRSWYDTENVISDISEQLRGEKNRELIFKTLERILDETFQLETSELIWAIKTNDCLSHYMVRGGAVGTRNTAVLTDDRLLRNYVDEAIPNMFENCETSTKDYLKERGFKDNCRSVVVPFYSPECLEGVIILGERSNQEPYNERDIQFFIRLRSYVSAILYRLTPFEKLEKQYFENRQKLHEAEIQLLRAQKVEAIVHATRQCHHEIRTPLNIIRLGIGRIKNLNDLESYKNIANEEITRALEIIEETLSITDVSKSEDDRVGVFDINEPLRRSAKLVDVNKYELEIALEDGLMLRGVSSDIQVVAANLIHNALEVMPAGGHVVIRSYSSQGNINVEIEDDGPGIAENLRAKVWEPYFSGQETEVGNSNAGRGWGLTIVNRIITEHQGTIKFESEIGIGTKFIITLPMATTELP